MEFLSERERICVLTEGRTAGAEHNTTSKLVVRMLQRKVTPMICGFMPCGKPVKKLWK
jgi:hypothetical protein